MFTGIVQQIGKVVSRTPRLLGIQCRIEPVSCGESIAINGACLTLKRYDKKNHLAYFDVMAETLRATNLGKLKIQSKVNIEKALKVGDSIGGHFISGHIDETGTITRINKYPNAVNYEIKINKKNSRYIIPKGSIAVDGISLTILAKLTHGFSVSLIPLTLKETTLGYNKIGAKVNIEYDQMVKNTVNILADKFLNQSYITTKFLKEKGML
ncbi:MAG: riboflavin synthase [Elusimicrobia bacterium]|nr:riboflavin synthase [Elusimicrobiota bacterium]